MIIPSVRLAYRDPDIHIGRCSWVPVVSDGVAADQEILNVVFAQ